MPYKINKYCVCCHYCRMECPAEAINYVSAKYEIDPEKCTECGLCEGLCPISAISNSSLPPTKPQEHGLIELKSDLVVLGAGGSGLIAAVKYAQLTGKKVTVLEKAKKPGGNTNLAHGFMVFNSKWNLAAGEPDNRDDFVREAMKRVLYKLDNRIIEKAVYATGPFFDWLCNLGGIEEGFQLGKGTIGFSVIGYPYRKFANLKCRDQAIGPGWAGTYVVRKMLEYCEKLGIQVLAEHKAIKLCLDERGAISGVLAEDPGGQTKINCSACVVSTGGFGRSDEKLHKYFPEFFEGKTPIHRFSVPTNTGDGMDLGEQIGAEIAEKNLCVNMFGPAHHPFGYCGYRIMQQPEVVYINLYGKRWIDETAALMDSRYRIVDQPKEITYAIVDSNILEIVTERLIANPPDGTDDWILRDYRQEMEEELKLDLPLKKGDTLEELAAQMGVNPAEFVKEIKKYNSFCAEGRDDDFLKNPKSLVPVEKGPFYAFYGQRFSEGAFGGLKINEKTQVLNKEGNVIPGLYATGDAASANLLKDALGVISELTWCVSSGYIAGCSVAEFIN